VETLLDRGYVQADDVARRSRRRSEHDVGATRLFHHPDHVASSVSSTKAKIRTPPMLRAVGEWSGACHVSHPEISDRFGEISREVTASCWTNS